MSRPVQQVTRRPAGMGFRLSGLSLILVCIGAWAAPADAAPPAPVQERIVFGSDHNDPPFAYLDEQSRPAGFLVDLVRAICEVMGCEVEIRLLPHSEIRDQLEPEGTIDFTDVRHSSDQDLMLAFGEPFTFVHDEIFMRRGSKPVASLGDLRGLCIAVLRDSFSHMQLQAPELGLELNPQASEPDALRAVADGSCDAAIVGQLSGHFAIKHFALESLPSTGAPILPRAYSFAVARDRGDLLLAHLDQGLRIVKASGRYDEIYDSWLRGPAGHAGAPFRYLGWLLPPVGIVIAGMLLWSRSLSRQVDQRTNELQAELSERLRMADAMRAQETYFRSLIELGLDVIAVANRDGSLRYVSPSAERLIGRDDGELLLRPLIGLVHPDDVDTVLNAIQGLLETPGASRWLEIRARHGDGSWRRFEMICRNLVDDPVVGGIVVNARDVTEREILETQLRQSQKLDAIGQLASGIAHDFNNILTAIIGYSDLLLDQFEGDAAKSDVEQIRDAANRAAKLTSQLLAFGRKQVMTPRVLDLNLLIRNLNGLLRRLLGEDVELITTLDDGLSPVRADPGQLEQVIVNLAVNARDAMPGGGRLTIHTRNISAGEMPASPSDESGPQVLLAVTDTGTGMAPEVMSHIFEPFFTTKDRGRGTGLGLATVFGIVKQSGGQIRVVSREGAGSTFRIYLPQAAAAVDPVDKDELAPPARASETVLVVEDEPAVLALARRLLAMAGYRVLEARDRDSAISVARSHSGPIHLLLADVVLPGASGRELAERIVTERPEMRVLYMSGYPADAMVQRGILEQGIGFVQKPFTPERLVDQVRKALRSD